MKAELKFNRLRETKGTVVFTEDGLEQIVGTLYVKKVWLEKAEALNATELAVTLSTETKKSK